MLRQSDAELPHTPPQGGPADAQETSSFCFAAPGLGEGGTDGGRVVGGSCQREDR